MDTTKPDIKPYPEWICEDCEEKATHVLKARNGLAGFRMPEPDGEGTCGVCGDPTKPTEEPCYLGYPVFDECAQPTWQPSDEDI